MAAAGDVERIATVFDLLADVSRMRVVLRLQEGEARVQELSQITGQSQSALSHALRLLRAHQVVAMRREGQAVIYRLTGEPITLIAVAALRAASAETAS